MGVKVSIVIPNYNGERFLRKLFDSLLKQQGEFEVILVDDMSTDRSLEIASEYLGRLRLRILRNSRRMGFTGSCNRGARAAEGRFIVFLNNDVHLHRDWLRGLLSHADEKTVVQSLILTYDGKGVDSAGNPMDAYGAAGLRFYPWPRNLPVFYASGASVLVPRRAFRMVGGFDEEMFMYHDDADLCWRLRLLGLGVEVATESVCYHYGRRKMGRLSPLKVYYTQRNRIRMLLKNYGPANVARRLPIALFFLLAGALVLSLIRRDGSYMWYGLRAVLWNARNIRSTLAERLRIQARRKVPDKEIEKHMTRLSGEIMWLKNILYDLPPSRKGV